MIKTILTYAICIVLFSVTMFGTGMLVSHFTYEKPAPEPKVVDIQQEMITNACGFPAVSYDAPEYKHGKFWPAECGCDLEIGCGDRRVEIKYYSPELYKD